MNLADTAPILNVEGVAHAYGGRPALRGVDLTLRPGEIYALLGPNGAGKTTLTRAICGRLKPDAGRVRLAGEDPWTTPRAREALGLAPQELALYGHMTVRENLEVFARLSGVTGVAVALAVDAAMEVSRTADRTGTPVKALSGGYQRRVNIAAAILHRPRLLILDEPTVGVDMAAREAVDRVIHALAAEGVAVLVVTHDLEEAGVLATRVGFLQDGQMVLEGEPASLIREAFGDRMQVVAQVADAEGHEQDLASAGLSPSGSPGVWTSLAQDGYGAAERIDRQLREAGVALREIRVRAPSLSDLFGKVAEDKVAEDRDGA